MVDQNGNVVRDSTGKPVMVPVNPGPPKIVPKQSYRVAPVAPAEQGQAGPVESSQVQTQRPF